MSRKGRKSPRRPGAREDAAKAKAPVVSRRDFARVFTGRFLFWLPAVVVVWFFLTPVYNFLLIRTTEVLLHVAESPDATRLTPYTKHRVVVTRSDASPERVQTNVKVTDVHFPLILLGTLFLAVPGKPFSRRLAFLGAALLIAAGFHLLTLFCEVKSFYANGLGEWSTARYGVFGRNFWGLSKHLLNIPVKLALPFVLWAAFYVRLLLPERN